jgi:protein gp37
VEDTKIQWAHHTFNPWRGCTKVSAGCTNCYAEAQSKRNPGTLGVWGNKGTRVVAGEHGPAGWAAPLKWQKAARAAEFEYQMIAHGGSPRPETPRVFSASVADVFEQWDGWMLNAAGQRLFIDERDGPWRGDIDSPVTMHTVRARLFNTIRLTPHLDWLLVTKRIEHVETSLRMTGLPWLVDNPVLPPNVWLLPSVETQATADFRIPLLLKIPAAVRGISLEPMLERVDLRPYLPNTFTGFPRGPHLDWVIVGGESGRHARKCNVEWVRGVVSQCKAAGVPVFVKQLGKDPVGLLDLPLVRPGDLERLSDSKGGDPAEWPEDLRVREFPTPRSIA